MSKVTIKNIQRFKKTLRDKQSKERNLLRFEFEAGKPWKFAGSFYFATTVLTTIGWSQYFTIGRQRKGEEYWRKIRRVKEKKSQRIQREDQDRGSSMYLSPSE